MAHCELIRFRVHEDGLTDSGAQITLDHCARADDVAVHVLYHGQAELA